MYVCINICALSATIAKQRPKDNRHALRNNLNVIRTNRNGLSTDLPSRNNSITTTKRWMDINSFSWSMKDNEEIDKMRESILSRTKYFSVRDKKN